MDKINLYTAIEKMKEISADGGTFSIAFRKYDRQRRKGGDLVRLTAVRLRKKTSDDKIDHASYKLFLVDTETGRALNCWQILVVRFNGIKTHL